MFASQFQRCNYIIIQLESSCDEHSNLPLQHHIARELHLQSLLLAHVYAMDREIEQTRTAAIAAAAAVDNHIDAWAHCNAYDADDDRLTTSGEIIERHFIQLTHCRC